MLPCFLLPRMSVWSSRVDVWHSGSRSRVDMWHSGSPSRVDMWHSGSRCNSKRENLRHVTWPSERRQVENVERHEILASFRYDLIRCVDVVRQRAGTIWYVVWTWSRVRLRAGTTHEILASFRYDLIRCVDVVRQRAGTTRCIKCVQ